MLHEARAAARWWTDNINKRSMDSSFTHRQSVFEDKLVGLLVQRFEGHWYEDEPRRGSAYRAVVRDLRCDPILAEAGRAAGLHDIEARLPPSTIVFINPGIVTVQREDEESEIIFEASSTPTSSPERVPSPFIPERVASPFCAAGDSWSSPNHWSPSVQFNQTASYGPSRAKGQLQFNTPFGRSNQSPQYALSSQTHMPNGEWRIPSQQGMNPSAGPFSSYPSHNSGNSWQWPVQAM